MLHPAPPPGGTAPAWMERVSVTLPAPSPGEVPVGLEREVRRDAERDRLAVARLTLTARRLVAQLAHRAWRWPTPGRDSQLGGGTAADRPRPG